MFDLHRDRLTIDTETVVITRLAGPLIGIQLKLTKMQGIVEYDPNNTIVDISQQFTTRIVYGYAI